MSPIPEAPAPSELSEHAVEGRLQRFDVDRRTFLELVGGGLMVCLCAQSAAQESGRLRGGHELPKDLSAWLHIDEKGRVTVFTGKVEVGQNIRTSLAQQVAEELRISIDAIQMVMGDTDLTPWDAGTFGSRTTPTMAPQLRAAAATAREALLDLAVERWKTNRADLSAETGRVIDRRAGRSIGYGELTRGEKLMRTVSAEAALSPASAWRVAGTPSPKTNGRDFVTGRHAFTSDVVRPGLLHGRVLRPPSYGAVLVALDTAKAEAIAGVRAVRDGNFAGVVAADPWSSELGIRALEAQWQEKTDPPSNRDLFERLRRDTEAEDRGDRKITGLGAEALSSADVRLRETYTVAYIAHAPLEPRAAVAEWSGDRLTVWTGTQRPFAVRDELAEAFHVPAEKVRVLVPDTGSAYGGKHTGDAAIEAARLARFAGKPVKLVWTRQEEFTWAYFRPAGVIDVAGGARRDGALVAWEFHNYNSGPAGIGTPYDVPNQAIQFHPAKAPLRQGSYRALAATANHFARESHMDELAAALRLDPLAFRLKNLSDARLRAVFEGAADKFGWNGRRAAPGRGFGIAGGVEKGSYMATCVELEVEPGSRRVALRRIVAAFECGAVVNPNGLRNQVEGAIVQGIGGALFEAIRFEKGRIANAHFSEYRVPRLPDVPAIEVVLLDRKDLPSAGAGETPIVTIAPAIAGAIYEAAAVRLRSLPLAPDGVPQPAEKTASS